jgi:hypothetical protein
MRPVSSKDRAATAVQGKAEAIHPARDYRTMAMLPKKLLRFFPGCNKEGQPVNPIANKARRYNWTSL